MWLLQFGAPSQIHSNISKWIELKRINWIGLDKFKSKVNKKFRKGESKWMTRLLGGTDDHLLIGDGGNSCQRTSRQLPTLLQCEGFGCIWPNVQNGKEHQFWSVNKTRKVTWNSLQCPSKRLIIPGQLTDQRPSRQWKHPQSRQNGEKPWCPIRYPWPTCELGWIQSRIRFGSPWGASNCMPCAQRPWWCAWGWWR